MAKKEIPLNISAPQAEFPDRNRVHIRYLSYLLGWGAAILLAPSADTDAWAKSVQLCPRVVLEAEIEPGLSDTEKRLVCGDLDEKKPLSAPWRDVPASQARFHMSAFLQDRGFYISEYRMEGGVLHINPGAYSRVSKFELENAPVEVRLYRKRGWMGEKITPALLDEMEKWVFQRLQAEGYACAKVRSRADARSGAVVIEVDPRDKLPITRIEEENIAGVTPGMLRRYDAFRLGEIYNADEVTLTERRVLGQGMVQSIHFTEECMDNGVALKQQTVAGLPRLLSFGVGVNTEGILLGKASWKNTRLGNAASSFEVSAIASAREQRFTAAFTWFPLSYPSRKYLRPITELVRSNEKFYETATRRLQFPAATSWDGRGLAATFRAGPGYEIIKMLKGSGPRDSHFLSLDTEARLTSHYFEFFKSSPRSGFSVSVLSSLSADQIGSSANSQRVRVGGESLWNLGNLDPPLVILGTRAALSSTFTGEILNGSIGIPPNYRYFLGGSQDLRGFGRNEVPGNELGGLSSGFASFEARLGGVIPYDIQPFVFVDIGALGLSPGRLDRPLYWSPGGGIRWESPIGAVRASLAHGYVSGASATELSHLQFYFSLGEEF